MKGGEWQGLRLEKGQGRREVIQGPGMVVQTSAFTPVRWELWEDLIYFILITPDHKLSYTQIKQIVFNLL